MAKYQSQMAGWQVLANAMDLRLLPWRSQNHYMRIFINYPGDLNLIPWISYLTFIPLKFGTGPQVLNLNPDSLKLVLPNIPLLVSILKMTDVMEHYIIILH